MRPSKFEAIRPYLERAVEDIDYFFTCEKKWENAKRELFELYDLMEAVSELERWENEGGLIAADERRMPDVRGKPVELMEEQKKTIGKLKSDVCQHITDEQAEALAALPGEPMSDEQWNALHFALRGGWRESSHQAAAWLREVEETVAAEAIDVELSLLPDKPREATELPGYRDAEGMAAEQVRMILATCLEEQLQADAVPDAIKQLAKEIEQDQELKLQGRTTRERPSYSRLYQLEKSNPEKYKQAVDYLESRKSSRKPTV